MTKLYQAIFCDLVITRHRGGITADYVLRQVVNLNTTFIQVTFYRMPIGRLAQVFQQMAQPVVTQIQRRDDLSGQAAQGVVHALEGGFHRDFAMIAFRDDLGQPHDRCPPPTEPPLRPMTREMPGQDLRQAHLDHLPHQERYIVDPLCEDDQFTSPNELRGLWTQLHAHGVLSSLKVVPIRLEDNHLPSLVEMPLHQALRAPPEN